jgi:hypothetical protein
MLLGAVALSETTTEGDAGKTPLQQATESAYRQVFALGSAQGPLSIGFRAELMRCVGNTFEAVYLRGDVCRPELLLEIEGTAAHPMVSAPGQNN